MLKRSINLVPARPDLYQAKLVFYLFMASLGMFFISTLLTYLIIRTQAFNPIPAGNLPAPSLMLSDPSLGSAIPSTIQYVPLRLPTSFWASTAVLLLTGVFLQRACWLVHRERQLEFRRWLVWAWAAAVVFVAVQCFGMNDLLKQHFTQTDGSTKVYGMSFTLAFIHALHVVGGVGFLGFVIFQAFRNRYDHERHWAVDHCAGYWHFLDIVWVSMLVMFTVTK